MSIKFHSKAYVADWGTVMKTFNLATKWNICELTLIQNLNWDSHIKQIYKEIEYGILLTSVFTGSSLISLYYAMVHTNMSLNLMTY